MKTSDSRLGEDVILEGHALIAKGYPCLPASMVYLGKSVGLLPFAKWTLFETNSCDDEMMGLVYSVPRFKPSLFGKMIILPRLVIKSVPNV